VIEIESEENVGTEFKISFPQEHNIHATKSVVELNLNYEPKQSLKELFLSNRKIFVERLLIEAIHVRAKIDEVAQTGNIKLLANAHRLVLYAVDGKEHELISFARAEGVNWAKYSLTLSFELEWMHAIRRVLWDLLYNDERLNNHPVDRET